jgi:hypothetical protein
MGCAWVLHGPLIGLRFRAVLLAVCLGMDYTKKIRHKDVDRH